LLTVCPPAEPVSPSSLQQIKITFLKLKVYKENILKIMLLKLGLQQIEGAVRGLRKFEEKTDCKSSINRVGIVNPDQQEVMIGEIFVLYLYKH